MNERNDLQPDPRDTSAGELPHYESPSIQVLTEAELLAQMGPSQFYNPDDWPHGF